MGRSEETAGSRLPWWHDEGVLKRGQQHPLKHRSLQACGVALNLSELLLFKRREQPGLISHPRILPIDDLEGLQQLGIGSWKQRYDL